MFLKILKDFIEKEEKEQLEKAKKAEEEVDVQYHLGMRDAFAEIAYIIKTAIGE